MKPIVETLRWMCYDKNADVAVIRMLKRVFIEDRTPWWFSIAALCFAMLSCLMGIIIPSFFGLWVKYENVEWPILHPIIMQMWGAYGYLVVLLLGYGMITLTTDTWRK